MEFIKKNYEKIILSAVLLGLVGVVAFLPVFISRDRSEMDRIKVGLIHPHVEPLPDLNLSQQDAALSRISNGWTLNFSAPNRLFNPVMWQRDRNGNLIKIATGQEVGATAVVVGKITPLYFQISLESVETNLNPPIYKMMLENQTAPLPYQRRPIAKFVSVGETVAGLFTLKAIQGPPDNPTELDLRLADGGEIVTVSANHPYRRVDGYTADIKYPPENFSANGLRVGAQLNFAGDQYNIIAIESNDVILLAQSNQKKYILPYAP